MARKLKPQLIATLEHGGLANVQDQPPSPEQLDVIGKIVEGLEDEDKETLLGENTEVRIILRVPGVETWVRAD